VPVAVVVTRACRCHRHRSHVLEKPGPTLPPASLLAPPLPLSLPPHRGGLAHTCAVQGQRPILLSARNAIAVRPSLPPTTLLRLDRQNGGERQWPRGRRRHQGGVRADLPQAQGGAARRSRLRVHHGVAPVDRSRNHLPPSHFSPSFFFSVDGASLFNGPA
jgi:hypothetical protein